MDRYLLFGVFLLLFLLTDIISCNEAFFLLFNLIKRIVKKQHRLTRQIYEKLW